MSCSAGRGIPHIQSKHAANCSIYTIFGILVLCDRWRGIVMLCRSLQSLVQFRDKHAVLYSVYITFCNLQRG